MKFYSLNRQSSTVDFKEATIRGQAPDKGLYFPESIPKIDDDLLKNIEQRSNADIAFRIIKPYVGDSIPPGELSGIIEETLSFPIPLVKISEHISSLELFHGPTLAFKDVGARFMSRCLRYFFRDRDEKITILVATSGDTGGAVANGFFEVDSVNVVILYPSGKISKLQEQQITGLGKNIFAIEVDGSFDDCQQLVKKAFADEELNKKLVLTSANSINVARWLPQQFYFFFAWKQWKEKDQLPVISVPSGNFGNICAGLIANASGLPVKHFIAACNANDTVPEFLSSGNYIPKKSVSTISNAMDVGDPNNFIRIMEIFDGELEDLKKKMSSVSVSDSETRQAIKDVFENYNYQLDPHGAVGYYALQQYIGLHKEAKGIFLETAHPKKFVEQKPLPDNFSRNKIKTGIDYKDIKDILFNLSDKAG